MPDETPCKRTCQIFISYQVIINGYSVARGQIALEFIVMYAIIVIVFILMFGVITTQRAISLNQQQYSLLQLQATTIAGYINQAQSAGPGYSTEVPIVGGPEHNNYTIYISNTGVIILKTKIGKQVLQAYAFSVVRNMIVNGTQTASANGISLYQLQSSNGKIKITNYGGYIYVDEAPVETTGLAGSTAITGAQEGYAAQFNGQQGSYISLGSNSLLSPDAGTNGDMTLCAWYNVLSLVHYNGVLIKGESSPSNGNAWEYTLDQNGQNQGFTIWTSSGTNIASFGINSQPKTNTWYFACFTYDYPLQESYYYLDAVKYTATFTYGTPATAGTGSLVVGSGEYTGGGNYGNSNVIVANLQIYNTSLSSNQITQLYNQGIFSAPVAPANLVGWWPLNGNAYDYSGHGNNGQFMNTTFIGLGSTTLNLKTNGGTAASNTLIGLIASGGLVASNNTGFINSNQSGVAKAIFTFNKSAELSAYTFDGNSSTTSNIIAWWPLSTAASRKFEVGILINNAQSTATGANFQQMVYFDPQKFSTYEAQDLGNIRFYSGGTELYSWCESGCTSSSSNALFWVKLITSIPAYSSQTINMTFLSNTTQYDGIYAGEAPQLSPTYAEYDNGAKVFPFYDNFAGTTLNTTKWKTIGTPTVNDGLVIESSSQVQIESSSTYNNMYYTADFNIALNYPVIYCDMYFGLTSDSACSEANPDYIYWDGYWTAMSPNTFDVYSFWSTSSTVMNGEFNYGSERTITSNNNNINGLQVGMYGSTNNAIEAQWVRMRLTPPNGVMPGISLHEISNPVIASDIFGSNEQNSIALSGTQQQNQVDFSAAKFIGTNSPKPISHIYITLTNSQSSATLPNFQEMISFDPQKFSSYESSDLGNIRFYSGNGAPSTELYSWCESGCTASSTNAVFWINLGSATISANGGTQIINMTFLPTSTEYDGIYAGEAPQLSPSYAEYDNGAKVFNYYINFEGTSLPSGWTYIDTTPTYNVNNGLTIDSSSGYDDELSSGSNTFFVGNILDVYGNIYQSSGTAYLGFPTGGACNEQGVWIAYNSDFSSSPELVGEQNGCLAGYHDPTSAITTSSANGIYTVALGSEEQVGFSFDYGQYYYTPISTNGITSATPIGIFEQGLSNNMYIQYLRIRNYPPNGVMPSFSFGQSGSQGGDAITITDNSPLGGLSASFASYTYGSKPYIPILISNPSSAPTPSGFQQQIYLNPSSYAGQMATDLGNIRFYSGQTELYSWCESGCTSSSTNAVFWVNLGSTTIPADSQITINATLLPTSTEYDGVYAGEAPQLSPTYAQYDNGASVFDFYDNFKGTTLNTNLWNPTPWGGSITINNGAELDGYIINSISKYTLPQYLMDVYGYFQAPMTGYRAFGFVEGSNSIQLGDLGGYYLINYNPSQSYTGLPNIPSNTLTIFTIGSTNTYSYIYSNYANFVQDSVNLPPLNNLQITIEQTSTSLGNPIFVKWVRVRQTPPNGVMPSEQVQSIIEPPKPTQSFESSGLSTNQNFTAVTWVNYNGGGFGCEGVFGSGGYTTNGFQLIGYPGTNCGIFYLDSYAAPWPSGLSSLPVGKWVMLTGEYQSKSGQMYSYINGSLVSSYDVFGSGPVTINTIPSNGLYYIGNAAWSTNGLYTFNGLISNVQLYNKFLTQSQIQSLYSSGPYGVPIQNSNMIGWWPLDGTPNDYSGYGNNATSGASFVNSFYDNPSGSYLGTFNQTSNIIIPSTQVPYINGPFSISFSFSTEQPYTSNFVSELIDGTQPNGGGLNISICGGQPRAPCPNYGINTTLNIGTAKASDLYHFGFSTNTLYDVTETFSDTGSTLYLNGINVSSMVYNNIQALVGSNNYLEMGGSSTGNALQGQMANIQIYNSILTPSQVMQLYEQGMPPVGSVNLTG